MSALLLSILGLTAGLPHCPMWKRIAPCSCRLDLNGHTVTCADMASYGQVVDTLGGHFGPRDKVALTVAASNLTDLHHRSLGELNVTLVNLKLNRDDFG